MNAMSIPYHPNLAAGELLYATENFDVPTSFQRHSGIVASAAQSIVNHGDPTAVGSVAYCCNLAASRGGGTVILAAPNVYTFTSNYTVPLSVTLIIQGGAQINLTGSAYLVCAAQIIAPSLNLFAPTSNKNLYTLFYDVRWFGFTPNTFTTNVEALNACVGAATQADEIIQGSTSIRSMVDVFIPAGYYLMNFSNTAPTINLAGHIQIRGAGQSSTILKSTDTTIPVNTPNAMFTVTLGQQIAVKSLTLQGAPRDDIAALVPGVAGIYGLGIKIVAADIVDIDNVAFVGMRGGAVWVGDGGSAPTPAQFRFRNNLVLADPSQQHATTPVGIVLSTGGYAVEITDNNFDAITKAIVLTTPANFNGVVSGIDISRNTIQTLRQTPTGGPRTDYPSLELTGVYVALNTSPHPFICNSISIANNLISCADQTYQSVDNGGVVVMDANTVSKARAVMITGNILVGCPRGISCFGVSRVIVQGNLNYDNRTVTYPNLGIGIIMQDCVACLVAGNINSGTSMEVSILDKNIVKSDAVMGWAGANRYIGNVPAESGIPILYDRNARPAEIVHRIYFQESALASGSNTPTFTVSRFSVHAVESGAPTSAAGKKLPLYNSTGTLEGYIPVHTA